MTTPVIFEEAPNSHAIPMRLVCFHIFVVQYPWPIDQELCGASIRIAAALVALPYNSIQSRNLDLHSSLGVKLKTDLQLR